MLSRDPTFSDKGVISGRHPLAFIHSKRLSMPHAPAVLHTLRLRLRPATKTRPYHHAAHSAKASESVLLSINAPIYLLGYPFVS